MSLLSKFAPFLDEIPACALDATRSYLLSLEKQVGSSILFANVEELEPDFVKVVSCSQFVAEALQKAPALLSDADFLASLLSNERRQAYQAMLSTKQVGDEEDLMRELRQFRRREMLRIAWRDLSGRAELDETLLDLSRLADCCIQFALDFLYAKACQSKGAPTLANGQTFNLVVLGMGKLGANELNFSSDIDLIFAYAEQGELQDRQQTSYFEFFSRLARSLVKVLDAITADGFVFRTDIRLRPFGDSGPMVMSFDGMENYYQTQAREWERYAMVKVRQVAGDFDTGAQLMAMFQPFVYRRYLDYGAIEELRILKYKITQELQRKDRMQNIKLGPGGIREIEFIGQAFQLVRGGQEKSLRQRGILGVLQTLSELELLTRNDAEQLQIAYRFLRRLENHIQAYQDKQTHDLPNEALAQALLAFSMGFSSWADFKDALDQLRNNVHAIFDQVFALSKQEQAPAESTAIWSGNLDHNSLILQLQGLGLQDAESIIEQLKFFKNSLAVRRLTAKGAGVLDRLMPQVLDSIHTVSNPDVTLKRILKLLEDIAGRSVYLSLLEENPDALQQLLKLSSASPWICEYLTHYPALLDELLDARTLYEPLKKQALEQRLEWQLQSCDLHDIEQFMIALRKFKQTHVLKVAAADIMGVIPIMVVSDYLTYIAEVVVNKVVEYSWQALTEKYGYPPGTDSVSVKQFAVIGFGKLGGLELSYGSDLDLVFIYDYPDTLAMTGGSKAITCAQFYARLGQQIRHILDTRMLSGVLYEVDLRLRPNGDSGLLVAPIAAYEDYLRNTAWTWEHQALVRARFIAGDPGMESQFSELRKRILTLPRERDALKQAVREMREKMRESLAHKEKGKFDLKQSQGGIADIEFIVQYGILAEAAQDPGICFYTDNVRLLEALASVGFISLNDAEKLKRAYCSYRDFGHKQVLQDEKTIIDESEISVLKFEVEQLWHELMRP